jgi:manganese efflux pump family protein
MTATFLSSVVLAAPLGTDSAALCTGIGATDRLSLRRRLTIAGTLTTFEAGMPVLGVLLAELVGGVLGESAQWLGGGLLAAVGLYMLRAAAHGEDGPAPLGTGALLLAALAVSIDEVAVGVSLGLGGVNLPVLVTTIGTIVFTCTMLGLTLGGLLAAHADRAGRFAAYALIIMGVLLGVGVL